MKEKRNISGDPKKGDAYCFVAIERNTKLVLGWHLGRRTAEDAVRFVDKLDRAAAGHFQVNACLLQLKARSQGPPAVRSWP